MKAGTREQSHPHRLPRGELLPPAAYTGLLAATARTEVPWQKSQVDLGVAGAL